MSVYRYKGSKVYTMDFLFQGQRIRESTLQTSKTLAKEVELARKMEVRQAGAGLKKRERPLLFATAAKLWLELKNPTWSKNTRKIGKTSVAHMLPTFGKMLLIDIEAIDISRYQTKRIEEGASPRTTNIEVGYLAAIMRKNKCWERVSDDVEMLPVDDDIGVAISPAEESVLLLECERSRSRSLYPVVTLAIDTGARLNVVKTLRWKWIKLDEALIRFGKDKTPAGTGREIPLNRRAVATLTSWAQLFPSRKPSHFVFPAEFYGASGDTFDPYAYATDPLKSIGSVKEAWEGAKKRTRRHCPQCPSGLLADSVAPKKTMETKSKNARSKKAKLYVCTECNFETAELPEGVQCRFHDLKHTAVSRMIEAGVPIPKVAKIVGWSVSTMVRMAARYSHFKMDDLRDAVETISEPPDVEDTRK